MAFMIHGIEGIGAVVFDEGGGVATPKPVETETMPDMSDYEHTKLDALYRFDDWLDLIIDAIISAAGQAAVD